MNESPSTLRGDRYAIIRLLGEGGQAATFEAVDKKQGKLVAIKRFRVRGAKSWKEVELAEREARVLASLSHQRLPRYIEHFEENGELFLVTEKIEGESLAALQKQGASITEGDVIRFLRETAEILDYLHARTPPVVHRDIKPSNVLRRADGSFVLIDFGAVRDKMKPEGGSTVVGTFGFMAPEQFQGRAMPVSDVYAVGATALTMLTGLQPENLPHKGLGIDVAAALGKTANPQLVAALSAMLEPDPDRRASNVSSLVASLPNTPLRDTPRKTKKEQHRDEAVRKSAKREKKSRDVDQGFGAKGAEGDPKPQMFNQGFGAKGAEGDPQAQKFERDIEQGIEEAVQQMEQGFSELKKEWEKKAEKHASKAERKARRAGRRAEQRAEQQARHEQRLTHIEARSSGIPQPLAGIFLFGITMAQIAVFVALRAIVPTLLSVLSIFFGKPLRTAAARVREGGGTAHEGLERAKQVIRGQTAPTLTGVRVDAPDDPVRVRVVENEATDAAAEEELAADEEADAYEKRRRRH